VRVKVNNRHADDRDKKKTAGALVNVLPKARRAPEWENSSDGAKKERDPPTEQAR